jgi:hypothetical protein
MKKLALAFVTMIALSATQAHASCASAALWAAEDVYGNDPMRTRVKQLNENTFRVTVGIGNVEDGAHTYQVTFEEDVCDPKKAVVCDLTQTENNDPRVCHD